MTRIILAAIGLAVNLQAVKAQAPGREDGPRDAAGARTRPADTSSAARAPRAPDRGDSAASPTPALFEPAPGDAPWVASFRGQLYYRRGCHQAGQLAQHLLVFFRSEEDARAAGYSRSPSPGC